MKKNGLKLNIQKSKIMASIPIISWNIEGKKKERKKVEEVTYLISLSSKITVTAAMKLKDTCCLEGYL